MPAQRLSSFCIHPRRKTSKPNVHFPPFRLVVGPPVFCDDNQRPFNDECLRTVWTNGVYGAEFCTLYRLIKRSDTCLYACLVENNCERKRDTGERNVGVCVVATRNHKCAWCNYTFAVGCVGDVSGAKGDRFRDLTVAELEEEIEDLYERALKSPGPDRDLCRPVKLAVCRRAPKSRGRMRVIWFRQLNSVASSPAEGKTDLKPAHHDKYITNGKGMFASA